MRKYWLEAANEELCGACEHTHAYAVSARCVSCDRAFCPLCVVVVAGEPFCPQCHDEGRRSRWRRGRSGRV